MNEIVIEQIDNFKNNVLNQVNNRDVVSFRLSDLDFDGGFAVGNSIIEQKALNKIFTSLRVRDTFLKYRNDMEKDDWEEIKRLLKDANQNTEFWGKKVSLNDGTSRITELFPRNMVQSSQAEMLTGNFGIYFDYLINALRDSKIEFSVKDTFFNSNNETVDIKLGINNYDIDIFQDNRDIWTPGANLNWDVLKVSSSPFFERLICSNGLTAEHLGFQANIQNKKFNLDKIEKEIRKLIVNTPSKFDETIQQSSAHLKNNNLSLREFFDFKKFFQGFNKDESYEHILMKVFDEKDIYNHYAVDIQKQSPKWLGTANSGRNAYDFFNDMTYLSTHIDETNIEPEVARKLNIKANDLFFKKTLDLEDVAPSKEILVSKVFEDNYN